MSVLTFVITLTETWWTDNGPDSMSRVPHRIQIARLITAKQCQAIESRESKWVSMPFPIRVAWWKYRRGLNLIVSQLCSGCEPLRLLLDVATALDQGRSEVGSQRSSIYMYQPHSHVQPSTGSIYSQQHLSYDGIDPVTICGSWLFLPTARNVETASV